MPSEHDMPKLGLAGTDAAPRSWKERILGAVAAERAALERELVDPEFRAQRMWERQQKAEAAKAQHERDQAAALRGFLGSCGMAERELDVLEAGISESPGRYPVVRAVKDFWAHPTQVLLLLCGGSGTGKTVAACWPLTQCRFAYRHPDFGDTWGYSMRPRDRGHYVLAGDLAAKDKFGPAAEKRMALLVSVRYLVVDELGQETMSEPWLSLLERIVGERHRAKLKTVLVTNLDPEKFKKQYGEAEGKGGEGRIPRRIRTDGKVFSTGQRRLFEEGT